MIKISELSKHFKMDDLEVNPLEVAEIAEFNCDQNQIYQDAPRDGTQPVYRYRTLESTIDYRRRALLSVLAKKMPFKSTANSANMILQTYVSVKCPYCEGATKPSGTFGHYRCTKCQASVELHLQKDGFSATP